MKYFFPRDAYGYGELYSEKIWKASLEDLAKLIKLCGLLMQAKVYRFFVSYQEGEKESQTLYPGD